MPGDDGIERGNRYGTARSLDFVLMPPIWLHEYAVDLFETDGLVPVAHGLEQRTDAEVAGGSENAFT